MKLVDAIESRRSHRYYKKGEVIPDEKIKELFRLTALAPSSRNLQPWEFILLQKQESRQKLFDNGCPQKQVLTSSALLIVLGNTDAAAHVDEVMEGFVQKGYFPAELKEKQIASVKESAVGRSAEENRVWTMRSTVLACQQLMLAATSLGIDSGPMEGFNHEKVRETFKIPEDFEIVMLISLGYREKEPLERLPRRSYDQIVHEEKF